MKIKHGFQKVRIYQVKKIIGSSLEDGFIYTVSEVMFSDGSTGLVSYVNDPDSLKYLATVVEKGGDVVLCNFNY